MQPEPGFDVKLQRQSHQARGLPGSTGQPNHAHGLAICADQDVQAIIEVYPVRYDPSRTSAEYLCRFEYRYRDVVCCQHGGRCHACPAAADDGNARCAAVRAVHALNQVRHAIHSLRIGLSVARVVRTLVLLVSISSSNER